VRGANRKRRCGSATTASIAVVLAVLAPIALSDSTVLCRAGDHHRALESAWLGCSAHATPYGSSHSATPAQPTVTGIAANQIGCTDYALGDGIASASPVVPAPLATVANVEPTVQPIPAPMLTSSQTPASSATKGLRTVVLLV
jgi:hypothetical protein